jgi:pyruvate ferredoxin oxidoreductase beta subunit
MNTGVQESGLTPFGTRTTTSVDGAKRGLANPNKKNMFEIIAAHNIGYAATASVGYPLDFIKKVAKAKEHPGTSYIHVLAPCPTGWSYATRDTIAVAKQAVDCGLWYLAEYENGRFRLNRNPGKFLPVETYLGKQGRFKGLSAEDVQFIAGQRDAMWKKMRGNWLE